MVSHIDMMNDSLLFSGGSRAAANICLRSNSYNKSVINQSTPQDQLLFDHPG